MIAQLPTYALFVDRLSYLFAILLVPLFFLLLIEISKPTNESLKVPSVLVGGIVFFSLATFSPYLIAHVEVEPKFSETPGILYPLFIVYFLSWSCFGLIRLYKAFRASEGFKRNQLKFFFLALVIAFFAAVNFFLATLVPSVPPLYYLIEILYLTVIAYAVIRFRLMDFDLLVRWGLARAAVILACGVVFFSIMWLSNLLATYFEFWPGSAYLAGALIMVLVYEGINIQISSFIDRFIFQSPDYKILLDSVRVALAESKSPDALAQNITSKLKAIYKVDHAGIVLWFPEESRFEPMPAAEFDTLGIRRLNIPITLGDFLIKTLETERRLFPFGIVLESEVTNLGRRAFAGERITFWKIRRTMHWLGAAACIPLMNKDRLMGFLVLGNKKSGGLYSGEDKKFLSHVSEIVSGATCNLLYGHPV